MPSYHYHLKFELYPSQDPAATPAATGATPDIWIPTSGDAIFNDLPSHPRRPHPTSTAAGSWSTRRGKYTEAIENYIPFEDRQYMRHSEEQQPVYRQQGGVIDCGPSRPSGQDPNGNSSRNFVILSGRQRLERTGSFPPPGFAAGLGPKTAARDWRFGRIRIESFDLASGGSGRVETEPDHNQSHHNNKMPGSEADNSAASPTAVTANVAVTPAASLGPTLGGAGQATRARYQPLETKNTEAGWGIVHLYRERDGGPQGDGSSGDAKTKPSSGEDKAKGVEVDGAGDSSSSSPDQGGTILCIPAVPSYLSPSDFLGFVGERWRGDVSHYRMVMTSRMNRYMVLMKFRDGRRATEWRKEFDGKVFNSMESEICHVTFIKSITVETPYKAQDHHHSHFQEPSSSVSSSLRPFPPPTADLVELPTCPVCLERMDDTTGLMTILCQHVFHCTCLQTWKGSGCPVCRATNPSLLTAGAASSSPTAAGGSSEGAAAGAKGAEVPFGRGVSNLCSVCDCDSDLWICLICGNVGCGRYKGGHAKDHWKETAHSFSLELETQHVWDYAGDIWVHRLIRAKGDGKVFELPEENDGHHNDSNHNNGPRRRRRGGGRRQRRTRHGDPRWGGGAEGGGEDDGYDYSGDGDEEEEEGYDDDDVVPRAKLDRIGLEYTHLLTSQLESQRVYFEELVSKAADKAAKASSAAESAASQAADALAQLGELRASHAALSREMVPSLERDVERERRRADKSGELARSLGRSLQEERRVGEGLMARIEHVNREVDSLRAEVEKLKGENEELRETNRDLTMFISGQEKLRELESEGKVEAGEVEGGTVSVPEERRKGGKGKGKGRAKK